MESIYLKDEIKDIILKNNDDYPTRIVNYFLINVGITLLRLQLFFSFFLSFFEKENYKMLTYKSEHSMFT